MNSPLITIAVLIVTGVMTFMAFQRQALLERWIFRPDAILVGKEYERMLTCGFIHGDWFHFGVNAFSFFMFGRNIEAVYGWASLLLIHLVSIIGGSILSLIIHRHHQYRALGASGGVCGVIFASIFLLPNSSIYLMFLPIPIPAYVYAFLFLLISYYGHKRQAGNVGHDAHLGGAVVGLLTATVLYPKLVFAAPLMFAAVLLVSLVILVLLIRGASVGSGAPVAPAAPLGGERERRYAENRQRNEKLAEIDRLLEKVSNHGLDSLTDWERKRLEELSREYRR